MIRLLVFTCLVGWLIHARVLPEVSCNLCCHHEIEVIAEVTEARAAQIIGSV
jgi:hypothetical protein